MNRRALILGTASGLLYGGWAFFANHGAGMPAGLRAAAVQFLLSFGATAVLTLAIVCPAAHTSTLPTIGTAVSLWRPT